MGIGNLNALKPGPSEIWETEEEAEESPAGFRSVGLDLDLTYVDDQRHISPDENFYVVDEEGTYFFVQLEGYEDGGAGLGAIDDDEVELTVGWFAVVTGNDESVVPLSALPLGSHLMCEGATIEEAEDFMGDVGIMGLTAEIASTFGAVFEDGHVSHFYSTP